MIEHCSLTLIIHNGSHEYRQSDRPYSDIAADRGIVGEDVLPNVGIHIAGIHLGQFDCVKQAAREKEQVS